MVLARAGIDAARIIVPLLARCRGGGTRDKFQGAESSSVGWRRSSCFRCWSSGVIPRIYLSLGLALYGLLAVGRGRWTLSGWLWGAAIVVQPLVLLLFPLQFVQLPKSARLRVCSLAVLPSLVFVGTPLLSNWSQTTKVLFHQANFPTVDHATPWIALSPRLSSVSVGAGPGRMIALVVAVGLGVVAWHYRPSMVGLLWLGAFALTGRCFFESVMVPFYLGPPCAGDCSRSIGEEELELGWWWRGCGHGGNASFRFDHLSEWEYWLPMVAMLAVGLACAYPGRAALGIRARHRRTRVAGTCARSSERYTPTRRLIAERPPYSGPTVCLRPGRSSCSVPSDPRASATTARVVPGSMTASTKPRSEACQGVRNRAA